MEGPLSTLKVCRWILKKYELLPDKNESKRRANASLVDSRALFLMFSAIFVVSSKRPKSKR